MREIMPNAQSLRDLACRHHDPPRLLLAAILLVGVLLTSRLTAQPSLDTEQITHGAQHHFFGYIGQSMTIPWNGSGRCSVRTDGTGLQRHTFIGGHPEWDLGNVVIGSQDGRQVRYDIDTRKIIGEIGSRGVFPNPEGDVSVSPDGQWFVNGFGTNNRQTNEYIVIRRTDGAVVRPQPFSRGPYTRGELRIDPAPHWNRDSNEILVPGVAQDGTRQLFVMRVK